MNCTTLLDVVGTNKYLLLNKSNLAQKITVNAENEVKGQWTNLHEIWFKETWKVERKKTLTIHILLLTVLSQFENNLIVFYFVQKVLDQPQFDDHLIVFCFIFIVLDVF